MSEREQTNCTACNNTLSFDTKRHYCKKCGHVFCGPCFKLPPHNGKRRCHECRAKDHKKHKNKKKRKPASLAFGGLPDELIMLILDLSPEGILGLSATCKGLRNQLIPLLSEYFSCMLSSPLGEGMMLFYVKELIREPEEGNLAFVPRSLPTITKVGRYPWDSVEQLSCESNRLEDNGQRSTVCKIPPECKPSDPTTKQYDGRHNEITIACGRYSSCTPNLHPYTVTDATMLYEEYPNLESIRCLFFMSREPVPNLVQLDMVHCVNKDYVLVNNSLSSAVYECGKKYGDFSTKDRGSKYLRELCPNLKYLKVSYPHLAWTDFSSCQDIIYELEWNNPELEHLPDSLEILAVETYRPDFGAGLLYVFKRK